MTNLPKKVLLRRRDVLDMGFGDKKIKTLIRQDKLHPILLSASGRRYFLRSEVEKLTPRKRRQ